MKKLFAFIIFFSICGTCFAADTITAEIESNNIKSYCINNQGYSYFNCFVKYAAPTREYWFRINLKFRDRLLPTINIVIDDKKYVLNAVEEYKKRHLKAGTGTEIDGNYNQEDFDCYIIPDNVDFIFGHPMAGQESKGIDHASAKCYKGANYLYGRNKTNKYQ